MLRSHGSERWLWRRRRRKQRFIFIAVSLRWALEIERVVRCVFVFWNIDHFATLILCTTCRNSAQKLITPKNSLRPKYSWIIGKFLVFLGLNPPRTMRWISNKIYYSSNFRSAKCLSNLFLVTMQKAHLRCSHIIFFTETKSTIKSMQEKVLSGAHNQIRDTSSFHSFSNVNPCAVSAPRSDGHQHHTPEIYN